jgi:tRNA U54 and U55 pseudouridine synthase Pus10
MKPLPILLQRLVKDGETCERCGGTYLELQKALETLRRELRPLDIEPFVETQELDEQTFKAEPSASNRIWIAGIPVEEWLDATVGKSRCCAACGDSECRTVSVGDATFETIPAALIIEAAMRAAARVRSMH